MKVIWRYIEFLIFLSVTYGLYILIFGIYEKNTFKELAFGGTCYLIYKIIKDNIKGIDNE